MPRNIELARLVREYLKSGGCKPVLCGPCDQNDLPDMMSLTSAIEIASRCMSKSGKKLSHQRRIKVSTLADLESELLKQQSVIGVVDTFDELYELVYSVGKRTAGIGLLTSYDVAERIGSGFLELTPELVYLHAGAAEGAAKFGIKGGKASAHDFPVEISGSLTPRQIEDFLCIYKARFSAVLK